MRRRPPCRRPSCAIACGSARRSPASWRRSSKPTFSNTGCTWTTRQISCMAKTQRRRPTTATRRLTGDIAKAVRAVLDKKAFEVVVLDLRHTHAFTDFFLLCSGQNTRQVQAIADAVEEALRAA